MTRVRVLHAAVWISDWPTTRAFYVDGLGLTHEQSAIVDGIDNHVVVGDDGAGLQFKVDPDGGPRVRPVGLDHLAVEVEDVDAVCERLVDRFGGHLTQSPHVQEASGNRVAFLEGPDGYGIELVGAGPG